MSDPRIVSLTATGPDGIVVELQLSGPVGCPADLLRSGAGCRSRSAWGTYGCQGGWLGEPDGYGWGGSCGLPGG